MGCHEDILIAIREMGNPKTFTPSDVITSMERHGTTYQPTTIRTHIVSRMCANAPKHHGTKYDDLLRVGRGTYCMNTCIDSSTSDGDILDGGNAMGKPGDSKEQQAAEKPLVERLNGQLGINLQKKRFGTGSKWLEVDGYSDPPPVLCEAWAHIGPAKRAQKNKVMTDAIKLLYISARLVGPARKILLFADEEAASHFTGESWMANCLREFDVSVMVVEMSPAWREEILTAQRRQYR